MKGCAYPVFGDNRIPLHMAITNFRFRRVAASCVLWIIWITCFFNTWQVILKDFYSQKFQEYSLNEAYQYCSNPKTDKDFKYKNKSPKIRDVSYENILSIGKQEPLSLSADNRKILLPDAFPTKIEEWSKICRQPWISDFKATPKTSNTTSNSYDIIKCKSFFCLHDVIRCRFKWYQLIFLFSDQRILKSKIREDCNCSDLFFTVLQPVFHYANSK